MSPKKSLANRDEGSENINNITLAERMMEDESADEPAEFAEKSAKRPKTHDNTHSKKPLIFMIIGVLGMIGGIVCIVLGILNTRETSGALTFPKISSGDDSNTTYSALTGEALADASLKNAPAYCIQTPNGMDGARPQAGLTDAGVVFEAIAEAGITRFAAIYQNPSTAIIGPVRSLRIYYLQWDTPFDCTIVHAGGADDALQAVAAGGYKDLSEDYSYMYRGTYGSRLWNNLFTTSAYLKKFSADHGYNTSNIQGFKRMTPEESGKARVDTGVTAKLDITEPTTANTSEVSATTTNIDLNMGGLASFSVHYDYDTATNTYKRSYASGEAHEVYQCEAVDLGEKNPEDVCTLTQLSPSVVIAMVVQEGKAADGYHEAITTVGSGKAYIFQNGTAIEGTWNKASIDEQIKFIDDSGKEVALAPGQTFITAVPAYGSVEY